MKAFLILAMLFSMVSHKSYGNVAEGETIYSKKWKSFNTNIYYGLYVKTKNGIRSTGSSNIYSPRSWANEFCNSKGYDQSKDFKSDLVPYNSVSGQTVNRVIIGGSKETFIPYSASDLVSKSRYKMAIYMSKHHVGLGYPVHRQNLDKINTDQCIEHILYMLKVTKVTCEKTVTIK